jgi:DNA recombination protein Rad52
MAFSQTQLDELKAPLSRGDVKTRQQAGRTLSYVEGWHVIAEANRIFGFDAWSSETIETRCVVERDRLIGKQLLPGWGVTYTARVRIVVDGQITRDGCGTGHGIDQDLGQAHESALKEAETDARKRALMTFGNPFGLALYDKEQANVSDDEPDSYTRFIEEYKKKIEESTDYVALIKWLDSPAEKRKREDFGVTAPDLIMLKNLVSAKRPKKDVNEQT